MASATSQLAPSVYTAESLEGSLRGLRFVLQWSRQLQQFGTCGVHRSHGHVGRAWLQRSWFMRTEKVLHSISVVPIHHDVPSARVASAGIQSSRTLNYGSQRQFREPTGRPAQLPGRSRCTSDTKDAAAAVRMKFGKSKEGYATDDGVKACPRLDGCMMEDTGTFSCEARDR